MTGKDDKRIRLIANIVLTILSLAAVLPFILLISSSLTDEKAAVVSGFRFLPPVFSMEAYQYIMQQSNMIFRAYGVTIFTTLVGTSLGLTITSLLGYGLTKDIPGKGFFNFFVVFTMLFNGGLVPTYMVYTTVLHIKNTYFALLMPNLLFSAFNAIIVRTYLRCNIPQELYESARIDGASELCIFRKLVLPLGKSIFVTIGIFSGLGYWNDWMNGLYYVSESSKYSIQQLLNVMVKNIQYLTQYGKSVAGEGIPSISLRMAIAFVAMVPVLILYPFLQKYFEKGITLGAVKG